MNTFIEQTQIPGTQGSVNLCSKNQRFCPFPIPCLITAMQAGLTKCISLSFIFYPVLLPLWYLDQVPRDERNRSSFQHSAPDHPVSRSNFYHQCKHNKHSELSRKSDMGQHSRYVVDLYACVRVCVPGCAENPRTCNSTLSRC